ncbi:hypothetical protein AVEN_69118-1 [Araneus ventricosus]|uniref:Peptidase aspartic putative domain-containing protein n=1 Tax=Araneus ventricosus TaxID=182803 RepID=A0A4Y2HZF4_ARAVE|nr:hypothetical protein AVEN_69118-1 [Araneus ventricosus]
MLFPLVESPLPDDTLRVWQRLRAINRGHNIETESSEPNNKKDSAHRMDLDGLLSFLLYEIEALGQDVICGSIPPVCAGLQKLRENNISFSDKNDGPIEILIGADIAGKFMTGGFKLLASGPAAIETKLG